MDSFGNIFFLKDKGIENIDININKAKLLIL